MRLKTLMVTCLAAIALNQANATPVQVTMNAISTTMTLAPKDGGDNVDTGKPVNKVYNFDVPAGEYILTAYATNGTTVNGTIVLDITDSTEPQTYALLTVTAYVTNKNADNSLWTIENGDYTLDVTVNTREGVRQTITTGHSTTAGRYTFLALNGNSYNAIFTPGETHAAEGYAPLYKGGTLTFNATANGAIPLGADYSITLPSDAELMVGMKFVHFTAFTPVEPKSVVDNGGTKTVTYHLSQGQQYNYRTWKPGGLTQAGYFTMVADESKRPEINFTEAGYTALDPHKINHDVAANNGYETGDILLNINERGHLSMNIGDTFDAHAMRMWEVTDNSTNNYFMEPDFHYTVLDLNGKLSTGVIEIDNADTNTNPWSKIKAVGNGTAIVTVTYDAMGVNYYSNNVKTPYLGGEYWGAIWPENTAVFVVTVGQNSPAAVPNMVINEKYNKETLKLAGNNVDAEHDVFYYLDTDEGATYTFTPSGVADITIAYPTIGERSATYSGFTQEGVTKNDDGSCTLLLKEGRQIVRLTDASGNATYQVLTAKPCHREIVNATRPGSKIFQPGDQVKIQYSGLRHPANKIAGIYNMSAYVTYNGIHNGSSLILGSGQYTFGSAASAQAVTVDIPADIDLTTTPAIEMTEGVIQVNGYGDPIGNHRNIDPVAGRSPNFTAIAHKTYFGAIPDVRIPLSAVRNFDITVSCNVADADITVTYNGNPLTPGADGRYEGTYGTYAVTATKAGYRCSRNTCTIGDDAEGPQIFEVEMVKADGAWDGKTLTEPALTDGVYQITNGSELAWFASHVNEGNAASDAVVTADIDLGDYDWTPVGFSSAKPFSGNFDGQSHSVSGLYINKPTATYQGLFGYLKTGSISGVTTCGSISAKQYVAGIVAYTGANATVDRCANYADISGTSTYAGGITATLATATSRLTNCYNAGDISGTTNCGGVAGYNFVTATASGIFNIGNVTGTKVGACIGGTTAKTNVTDAYSTMEYDITASQTLVTEAQMRSGEIACKLGEAFGQTIGSDEYPVLGGEKVYYNPTDDTYYNDIKTAIDEIDSDSDTLDGAVYYNISGQPSATPYEGFNIIRLAGGKIIKMIIR